MTAVVKIGRIEGFVSTYNLFFSNGLRLQTESLVMKSREETRAIRQQFVETVQELQRLGLVVEGTDTLERA